MINKFKVLKHKEVFYTEVSVYTGNAVSTIKGTWFNQTKGFNIPDCKIDLVTHILDRRLKIEKRQAEIEQSIMNNEPIKK